jgi:hypothetical protein
MNPAHFDPLPGESLIAFEGYMTWFGLKDRNPQRVAELMNVEVQTVRNWSSQFKWADRLLKYKADLLTDRVQAEAEVERQQTLARAEAQIQKKKEKAICLQEMRQAHRRLFDDYVLNSSEKTRLHELNGLLMMIEKLERMADQDEQQNPAGTSSVDAQFEEELEAIYSKFSPLPNHRAALPPEPDFSDGAGI